jgi:hypothetical protein
MHVDERRTARARERHQRGVDRLNELFAAHPFLLLANSHQNGSGRPVRLKPGCPPVRDAEHQAKHRKRKAARASRKRNRRR